MRLWSKKGIWLVCQYNGGGTLDSMKLRLIIMGCILIGLGTVLLILRGFSAPLAGLPVVGVVLAVIGFLWKPRKKIESAQKS